MKYIITLIIYLSTTLLPLFSQEPKQTIITSKPYLVLDTPIKYTHIVDSSILVFKVLNSILYIQRFDINDLSVNR